MGRVETLPFDYVLMEAIEEMVFLASVERDGEFRYAFLNQAVFERIGLDENALGKTFQEVHTAETAAVLNQHYKKALSTKETVVYEDAYSSASGERRYSKTKLTPILDESGCCHYIAGIVKDMTDEKLTTLEKEKAWDHLKESRTRYRSLFDNNSDAVLTLNLDGEILSVNQAAQELSGYSAEELIQTSLLDYVIYKTDEKFKAAFQQAAERKLSDVRTNFLHKSGEEIGALVKLVPIETHYGLVGMYAILKDMRELDKMARLLMDSEEKFQIIAENAHDVIVLMDNNGETSYVSPSSAKVYGFTYIDYFGKSPFHNVHPDDIPQAEKLLSKAIREAQTHTAHLRMKHKTKGWIWAELSAIPVFDENNQFAYMMTISQDITLQKEREAQLKHFAYHDSLTGLPNRRFFRDRLSEALDQFQESHSAFAVVLLDIDRFKNINDEFGHETGDAVIEEFGKRLSESIGENNLAARLGGDEFALLLTQTESEKEAQKAAEKIQHAMNMPWQISTAQLKVTTSIGIALLKQRGTHTSSSLLKQADHAMYTAKKSGRNACRISILDGIHG